MSGGGTPSLVVHDTAIDVADVVAALRTVMDPELGMSIIDLGLVYGLELRAGRVRITMTLTAPGCPLHDLMPGWVRSAVQGVRGVDEVDVRLVFEPPWTPARIATR